MDVQPITVPQSLAYVLNTAGDKSDVDFNYLLKTAMRESSLNPSAKAPSSSAVGLFQFLDSTWLQVMKEQGPRLGYQQYADAITKDSSGDYVVKDKKLRTEILKLREDPQIAADMAAAFTKSNGEYLEAKFGRMPSPGELYIAHFLGPQGAEKLFNAGLKDPDQVAAKLFPNQARANPQIFYDGKHPRTIREVYKALVAKHNAIEAAPLPDADPAFTAQQIAGAQAPSDVPPQFSKVDMSFAAMFANTVPPPQPTPLIGTEAAAPLIAAQSPPLSPVQAIDAAAGGPVALTSPLPAPIPLVPPDGDSPPLALVDTPDPAPGLPTAAVASPQPDAVPQPRIEMSPGVRPNSAFFTHLYWAQGGG